jgi:hypothetical protein
VLRALNGGTYPRPGALGTRLGTAYRLIHRPTHGPDALGPEWASKYLSTCQFCPSMHMIAPGQSAQSACMPRFKAPLGKHMRLQSPNISRVWSLLFLLQTNNLLSAFATGLLFNALFVTPFTSRHLTACLLFEHARPFATHPRSAGALAIVSFSMRTSLFPDSLSTFHTSF